MSHPFHLVDYSPWPLFASLALFSFALSIISFMTFASYLAFIGLIPIIIIAILWWRDLIREAIGGFHTLAVQRGLTIGFYLSFNSTRLFHSNSSLGYATFALLLIM
jgi:hypothetical protein